MAAHVTVLSTSMMLAWVDRACCWRCSAWLFTRAGTPQGVPADTCCRPGGTNCTSLSGTDYLAVLTMLFEQLATIITSIYGGLVEFGRPDRLRDSGRPVARAFVCTLDTQPLAACCRQLADLRPLHLKDGADCMTGVCRAGRPIATHRHTTTDREGFSGTKPLP